MVWVCGRLPCVGHSNPTGEWEPKGIQRLLVAGEALPGPSQLYGVPAGGFCNMSTLNWRFFRTAPNKLSVLSLKFRIWTFKWVHTIVNRTWALDSGVWNTILLPPSCVTWVCLLAGKRYECLPHTAHFKNSEKHLNASIQTPGGAHNS